MQLASKPVASHEHIIFSLKEYKVSLREPWLLWATFLFRLSVPIIGKPLDTRPWRDLNRKFRHHRSQWLWVSPPWKRPQTKLRDNPIDSGSEKLYLQVRLLSSFRESRSGTQAFVTGNVMFFDISDVN